LDIVENSEPCGERLMRLSRKSIAALFAGVANGCCHCWYWPITARGCTINFSLVFIRSGASVGAAHEKAIQLDTFRVVVTEAQAYRRAA
jgi:hypothetical protein